MDTELVGRGHTINLHAIQIFPDMEQKELLSNSIKTHFSAFSPKAFLDRMPLVDWNPINTQLNVYIQFSQEKLSIQQRKHKSCSMVSSIFFGVDELSHSTIDENTHSLFNSSITSELGMKFILPSNGSHIFGRVFSMFADSKVNTNFNSEYRIETLAHYPSIYEVSRICSCCFGGKLYCSGFFKTDLSKSKQGMIDLMIPVELRPLLLLGLNA